MDERENPTDASVRETTANLNDGLEACGKVVASYRAKLSGEPADVAATETESIPAKAS